MSRAVLQTHGLSKRFGGVTATDDVSLEVAEGSCHALIGPNGAGKTTLLSQLSGELRPSAGEVLFEGIDVTATGLAERARLGIARSFQITSVCDDFTVLDNVILAAQALAGHSFRFWRAARRDERLTEPAERALSQVGLSGFAHIQAGTLSHGQRRQLELAIVLCRRPRILLLDEPMAGIGPAEAGGMTALLASLKGAFTIVLVEHDMDAVFSLADTVSVLVNGRLIASGPPMAIKASTLVREAYLGDEEITA